MQNYGVLCATVVLILAMAEIAPATPVNLAPAGTATQSSTISTAGYPFTCTADNAIDGNTDGNVWNDSVSHTNHENQPWWQVDLLGTHCIDSIELWARTDFDGRLNNFTVSILDAASAIVWSGFHGPSFTPSMLFDVPGAIQGRFVKVQLDHANYLELAEVQVWEGASSTIPEPTTLSLLGLGLVGLGIVARRRLRR
jgi:NedA-like, galactose-binding domain/PEP-CTERM motif